MKLIEQLKKFIADHPQLSALLIVATTNVTDFVNSVAKMIGHVKAFFDVHKDVTELYFTSDGHAHFTVEQANHHTFWLENKTVTLVPREQVAELSGLFNADELIAAGVSVESLSEPSSTEEKQSTQTEGTETGGGEEAGGNTGEAKTTRSKTRTK
jgi:hypothetical protein